MQVQIEFTHRGSSSVFGNFEPGDTLRCSAEQARHFVNEAMCAKYVAPIASPTAPEAPAAKPAKPARKPKDSK